MKIGDISGTWNIESMELWDDDYLHMEVQAHLTFSKDGSGSFQFGLVRGYLRGQIYTYENREEQFEFTWGGNDESDEVFGYGWIKRESLGRIEGEVRFHEGDDSSFEATKDGYKKSLDVFSIKNREKRIEAIIKDKGMAVKTKTLKNYLKFLKENISLPYKVTGIDSCFTFTTYKGNTPDGKEKFEIIEFEDDVENSSNLFVKVRRLSAEGGIFSLQLFEFESINKKTIEHKILQDYSYWIRNHL